MEVLLVSKESYVVILSIENLTEQFKLLILFIPYIIKRGYAVAFLLELLVRTLLGTWMSVSFEYCLLSEVSATGWSFIQRNPTEFDMWKFDREARYCESLGSLGAVGNWEGVVLYHHGAVEEQMWNKDRMPREIIHSDSFRVRNLHLLFSF
jgi:hypothetical protein